MEDHTIASIYELLDSLAAGQRQIMEEQRRIHNRLDALVTSVNDTNLRLGGVETSLKRIELRLEIIETTQSDHENRINAIEDRLPA